MLLLGDCAKVLKEYPDNHFDLTITSPPYDNLRSYQGNFQFDFEIIAQELFRVTKKGGVVVWLIGDKTEEYDESGTSFKQALYFKEIGFKLYDTIIYGKNGTSTPPHNSIRYNHSFEYIFVFSKGKPKTFNPIKDVRNKTINKKNISHWRNPETGKVEYGVTTINNNEFRIRSNIWFYNVGGSITKDKIAFNHPALMNEKLTQDLIISWSNEGDIVLDPFCGSGTTCKMAHLLNRKWIGIEINPEYLEIAKARVKPLLEQTKLV